MRVFVWDIFNNHAKIISGIVRALVWWIRRCTSFLLGRFSIHRTRHSLCASIHTFMSDTSLYKVRLPAIGVDQ